MALKSKTPPGAAKGVTGGRRCARTRGQRPVKTMPSSDAAEARGAITSGAAKTVGTEVADTLR